jgi:hypothetical protein
MIIIKPLSAADLLSEAYHMQEGDVHHHTMP